MNQKFSPYCQRGGGSANVVLAQSDHKFCSADLPSYSDVASGNPDALGYDRDVTQTNACNTTDHEWRTGAWSGWSSTCDTTATSTRSVTCYRRFDNSVQPDSACSASARPASSRTEAQYASCSYSYSYSAWSSWSNTCSTSATRTRTATCVRSNNGGQNVAASECSNRGVSRDPISETSAQYGSCSYEFRTAPWTGWSSGCDTNASRNRDVWCERSNGDRVADSECTSRGRSKPAATESSSQYDACGYSWSTGGWGGWSSGCSNAATRSRSVSCTRSNNGGQTVSDAECTNRGLGRPASSETSPNYSGCSYEAVNWSGFSSCQNGVHTRTAQCRRSDGAIVGGPECSNRGVPVSQTTNCTTYSWSADGWSGWSACSFGEQSQTRNVRCMGSDGSIVSDSMCTGGKPATSQTQSCQAQCSSNSPILYDQRCLGGTLIGEFERNVRGTATCMNLCAELQGTSCVTFRTKKEKEEGKTHTDYQCRCYAGTTQTYADGGSNMGGGGSTDVSTGRSTNYNSMVCQ